MEVDWQYTLALNNSESELIVEYIGAKYALEPKGYGIIRWNFVDQINRVDAALPLLKFSVGDMKLYPVFSNQDLYDNKRIVILGDLVNSSSCRRTPRTYPQTIGLNDSDRSGDIFWCSVDDFLGAMVELEKKVRIWHNQCKHLLKKYQEAVERVERVFLEFGDFSERDLESFFMDSLDPTRVRHRHFPISLHWVRSSALDPSLLEGAALLRSCGESSYNQAAFALTSLPPSVPTFSKFALAIRELNWNVDCLPFIIERKPLSLDSWEWCEERCRFVFFDSPNRMDHAAEDESLEADVRRQNADRESFRSSLDLKLSKSPDTSSSKFLNLATWFGWRAGAPVQGELESIWRKRLQANSYPPGSYSSLDAFVIDNPYTSFLQVPGSRSRNGTSKSVQKCKWLGETVALSTMSTISKVSARAETGFLARVQHPNVVEWMGYAFQQDLRNSNCFGEFFLVTEHMECDLYDLITERLTGSDGTIIKTRPPFDFFVAVDIALQIVEAMIHVHRCRVIHRDLKPKNILASPKYSNSRSSWEPIQYTIKLIDFGSSKSGDQGSHFHTRKQGTPIYMAPEVWESQDRLDSYSWSADVYSFGLTCFEIFTGRLPLESGMQLTFANIQKVLSGEILFPPWCPAELKVLLLKCCAQNPSKRPSFEDVRKALWRLKVLYESRSFLFF